MLPPATSEPTFKQGKGLGSPAVMQPKWLPALANHGVILTIC